MWHRFVLIICIHIQIRFHLQFYRVLYSLCCHPHSHNYNGVGCGKSYPRNSTHTHLVVINLPQSNHWHGFWRRKKPEELKEKYIDTGRTWAQDWPKADNAIIQCKRIHQIILMFAVINKIMVKIHKNWSNVVRCVFIRGAINDKLKPIFYKVMSINERYIKTQQKILQKCSPPSSQYLVYATFWP